MSKYTLIAYLLERDIHFQLKEQKSAVLRFRRILNDASESVRVFLFYN